jgi:hypothetical protein
MPIFSHQLHIRIQQVDGWAPVLVYLLHVPSEKILARMLRGAIIDIASIGRGANVLSAVLFDLRLVAKYEDARNEFWLNLFFHKI